ncbi:MAG: lytic transglycosylase domain-containing protein [Bdellovibrionales bacterium]
MSGPAAVLAGCLMMAAQTYNVPPAVMVGIMNVEGGRIGQEVRNTNGTSDLGPMQINTIWMPELARYWGVDQGTARAWVRDNGCVNMHVAAWILRGRLEKTKNLYTAIGHYHSGTPHLSHKYAQKVVKAMERHGLIDYGTKTAAQSGSGAPPAKPQTIAQR